MTRFSGGPANGLLLSLRRAPLFLRVVVDEARNKFDALEQLTDEPSEGESLIAYVRIGEPSAAFVDWTEKGKRVGARLAVADYRHVAEQPPEWVMRDAAAWRAWCAGAQKRLNEPVRACPGCTKPLDERGRCFKCKEWLCRCGKFTGSHLISTCIVCQLTGQVA